MYVPISFVREVKLSSNRLTAFPLELALLPCLHVVDLSLNNVRTLLYIPGSF